MLVVDDDPLVGKVVEQYLKADGHEVHKTDRPQDALARLNDGHYGLVITDWAMPDMSGGQLAKEIKRQVNGMPVILMTGVDSDLAPQDLDRDSGIDLVIKKPLSRTVLRKAILRVMAQKA